MRKLTIAILLISSITSLCSEGCLKCNSDKECQISDILNLYKLNGVSAEKVNQPNCDLIDFDGNCLSCQENHSYDAGTGSCVAFTVDNELPNCAVYLNKITCARCDRDYYLAEAGCAAIENRISDCFIYQKEGACLICDSSFLLSPDSKKCISRPSVESCYAYSFVGCGECLAGFLKLDNGYLRDFRAISSTEERLSLAGSMTAALISGVAPRTSCESGLVTNCAEFVPGRNKCTKCSSGYYLDTEGKCQVYPTEPFENCQIYSSATACFSCLTNYYFTSTNDKCIVLTADKKITNCSEYDLTSSTVKCLKCTGATFLSSNKCLDRVKSASGEIPNCQTNDPINDKCIECTSGNKLTDDGLECKAFLPNCQTYLTSKKGEAFKCTACGSGFILKNIDITNTPGEPSTNCEAGTVLNCKTYQTDSQSLCLVCENGFVLEGNVCVGSNDIFNCEIFSSTDKTLCQKCSSKDQFNFIIKKECQQINSVIDNCAQHSGNLNSLNCDKCKDGYNLNNDTCTKIDIQNCLSLATDGKCTACAKNSSVSRDGSGCFTDLSFISFKCAETSTVDESNAEKTEAVTCNRCAEHAYPVDMDKHFVCVENDKLNQFSDNANLLQNNCVKYDENVECIQCDPTVVEKYLKATTPPSCVSGCGTNNAQGAFDKLVTDVTIITNTDNDTSNITQYNVCTAAGTITGCLAYAPKVNVEPFGRICLSCMDTHFPVIDFTDPEYSVVDYESDANFPYVENAFTKYPQVTCADKSTSKVNNSPANVSSNLVDNCEYYWDASANDYFCVKCKHGYHGVPGSNRHIASCVQDNDCNQSIKLYNLDLIWAMNISCHKCSSDGQIPFFAYASTSHADPTFTSTTEFQINKGANATFAVGGGTAKSVFCAASSHSTFGVATSSDYGVHANCGIGLLAVNTDGVTNYTDKFGTICGACKPGYEPTNHGTHAFIKTACTIIANCDSNGSFFNACEKCVSGYIHKYASSNISFTECIPIPTGLKDKMVNCLAASESNSEASVCEVCKKGYFLNKDAYCEAMTVNNCENNSFARRKTLGALTLNWSIYFAGNAAGCNKCLGSFSAVKLTNSHNVCVESEWITSSVDPINNIANTNYIPRCISYKAVDDATLVCSECDSGYVLKSTSTTNIDGTECFLASKVPDCALASTNEICIQCKSKEFALINNKCTTGTISDCLEYNYDVSQLTARCVKCADGFYITSEHKCAIGVVLHCETFVLGQSNKCQTCKAGFAKATVKNDRDYCYPLAAGLNCATATLQNNVFGGELTCLTCSTPDTHIIADPIANSNHSVCMPFVPIVGCNDYDVQSNFNDTTFDCTSCGEGFYYNSTTNRCVERQVKPPKCLTFSPTADTCSACDNSSYLFDGNKQCKDFPKGILRCLEYTSADTCSKCKPGSYLEDNKCITASPLINHCLDYKSNIVCDSCKPGFLLENNQCLQTVATNCLTYKTVNSCETCFPLGALEQSQDAQRINCVTKNILGCANINDVTHDCTECQPGLYLDEKDCRTPTLIPNCLIYSGKNQCKKCGANTVLSLDKKECNSDTLVPFIPKNCSDAVEAESPICSRCVPNYWFVDGECKELCTGADKDFCFTCDPDTPDKCFICLPGFFMDDSGVCKKVLDNNGGDGGGDDKSGFKAGVLSLVVSLILMIN